MNPKFEAASHERGDGSTYLKLAGVIDEDHGLAELTARLKTGLRLVMDLSEVEQVNEAGAEALHAWLRELTDGGMQVVLDRVAPSVVVRLNENPAFTSHAVVRSFQVPYFCPKCEAEQTHVVKPEEVVAGHPPGQTCSECGATAEFDEEVSYFRFLARRTGSMPAVE